MTEAMARPVVVILGMHRSGTSALAGALVNAGLNAGRALLPSTSDNANGYFEDVRLVAASDALLLAAGSRWDEPGPLCRPFATEMAANATSALQSVFAELADASLNCVVKDPRACRLVPEWHKAIVRAGLSPFYLMMVRHPDEVASSLHSRDGLSPYRAGQLWLEHLLEAEVSTRGLSRAFLTFEDLISDPSATLSQAFSSAPEAFGRIDFESMTQARSGVDPLMKRQHASSPVAADRLQESAYSLVRRAAKSADGGASLYAAFDELRLLWTDRRAQVVEALDDFRSREQQLTQLADARAASARQVTALVESWRQPDIKVRQVLPRIYWRRDGESFAENQSCAVEALEAGEPRFRCVFNPPIECAGLRIDPHDEAGAYEISGLLVNGRSVLALSERVCAASDAMLPASDGAILVIAGGDDPWVEVKLAAETVPNSVLKLHELEFSVRHRALPSLLWDMLGREAELISQVKSVREQQVELQHAFSEQRESQRDHVEQFRRDALEKVAGLSELTTKQSNDTAEILAWMQRRTFRYWWRKLWGTKTDGAV